MDKNKKLSGNEFINQVNSDIQLIVNAHERKKPNKIIAHKKTPKSR